MKESKREYCELLSLSRRGRDPTESLADYANCRMAAGGTSCVTGLGVLKIRHNFRLLFLIE